MTDTAPESFLTHDEVKRLTGRNRRALQVAWLRSQGIPYFVDALGWPVVARVHVFGREPATAPKPAARPAWAPAVLSRK
jgi:hypothetical protein